MPITVSKPIHPIDQDRFMEIDHAVMRHAFDIHNRYGAFCDERVYSDELDFRCNNDSLTCSREMQITLTHKSFRKTYYTDMVINGSVIYEAKATAELTENHHQQLLNYLLLTGTNHGKLLAFGGLSVQHRFVSTKLNPAKRREMTVDTDGWVSCCTMDKKLPSLLTSILEDWGGFLSVSLYKEALAAILSNGTGLEGSIEIKDGNRSVGTQKELLLAPDLILSVTGSSENDDALEKHLNRLLQGSSARAIQWVNFDHHLVTLKTLKK